MIEFKAECGHTIRAKDGDEGKVVRCSYCGRTSQVPDKADDEFASLFSDVADLEAGESVSAGEKVRVQRARPDRPGRPVRTSEPAASFNPFAVVLKMAYAAAIVIVLIVCAKIGYNHLVADRPAKPIKPPPSDGQAHAGPTTGKPTPGPTALGPVTALPQVNPNMAGLFVCSEPTGAEVRFRLADGDYEEEEIFLDPTVRREQTPCKLQDVPPGRYEIAVALRIDSPALDRYSGYQAQRRLVEESGSDSLMAAFFLPDEALELRLVDLSKGRLLVVRGYECELSRGEWYQLTALFLPDESVAVLLPYLPTPAAYGFKDDYVLAQLSYHDVPEFDRTHVVDALRRIGMVVYQYEKTKEYRCFRVALDGNLDSWVCVDRRAP